MATENPIPLLVFYFVLTHIVLVIALAVRPSLRWRFFVWLGIAYVCLRATKADAGESFVNYQTGSAFGTVCFNALHLLVIADPVEEWRHEMQDAPLWKIPFWRRVYWVLCAVWNSRGIGWNYQAANTPPFPKLSRKAFVLNRYLRILWHALLVDLCQSYMDITPLFSLSGPQAQSLRSQGVVLNVLNILAMFTPAYCMISISYDLLSIFAVALGVTEPRTWPLIFGEWKEAYTVRQFWSRTWHQNMRRFVSGTGKAVARALGCTPGTWFSARVQLLVGFSISGFAHVLGDAMVGRRFVGCSLPFFLLQTCSITLEDFAIACAKRVGIRAGSYARALGYVWTAVWFYWSAPLFADWGLKAGMGMHRTFGWSVARPLLGSLVDGALLERIKGVGVQANHTVVHEVL